MLVLAMDTSADVAVSLVEVDDPDPQEAVGTVRSVPRVRAARRVHEQRRHAELLAPMVQGVLADAGADRRDLAAVVVGTGPAPFTGLRAGLVTARVLAEALGIPVHGVPSLDAWAAQAFALGLDHDAAREVVVATDARRREVYTARYRRRAAGGGSGAGGTADHGAGTTRVPDGASAGSAPLVDVEVVTGPEVMAPAMLAREVVGAVVAGPGAALYPDHLTAAAEGPTELDPAVLAGLAVLRAARGEVLPTEPLYLRRPDVTPAAARKRATG